MVSAMSTLRAQREREGERERQTENGGAQPSCGKARARDSRDRHAPSHDPRRTRRARGGRKIHRGSQAGGASTARLSPLQATPCQRLQSHRGRGAAACPRLCRGALIGHSHGADCGNGCVRGPARPRGAWPRPTEAHPRPARRSRPRSDAVHVCRRDISSPPRAGRTLCGATRASRAAA